MALESKNNGKNSIFLEILTVINIKTLYWGVFEAADSNEKKFNNFKYWVALKSKNFQNRFFEIFTEFGLETLYWGSFWSRSIQ